MAENQKSIKQVYDELKEIFGIQKEISLQRMTKAVGQENFLDSIYFKIRYNTICEVLDLIRVCEISNIDKE